MASLEVLTELLSALEDNKTIIRDSIREAPAAINIRNRSPRTSEQEFEDGVAAAPVDTVDTGGSDGESGNDTQVAKL